MGTFEYIMIALSAFVAGSYGTYVGGGSFLTVPTLILLGVPAHTAIGSNRLGLNGLAIAGLYQFNKKGFVNFKAGFSLGIPVFIGAVFGSSYVTYINEAILEKMIGVMSLFILSILILKPQIGVKEKRKKLSKLTYFAGALFALIVGAVGSITGGVGPMLSYVLLLFFGETFIQSAGTRKIPGLVIALTGTVIYALSGIIDYKIGAVIFVSSFIGSFISAHFADTVQNSFVKKGFMLIISIMALKLLF